MMRVTVRCSGVQTYYVCVLHRLTEVSLNEALETGVWKGSSKLLVALAGEHVKSVHLSKSGHVYSDFI